MQYICAGTTVVDPLPHDILLLFILSRYSFNIFTVNTYLHIQILLIRH